MICERCKQRYGKIGEDYWLAKAGVCPRCGNLIQNDTRKKFSDTPKQLG
jgi:hypothetical protein